MTRRTLMLGLALAIFTADAAEREPLDPLGTVNAFQAALSNGDEATATMLLAPDVLIYESGGQERSRSEYAAGHLAGDIAFMAGAKVQRLEQAQTAAGDLAVVTTRSRIVTRSKDKAVDLLSTETMVLRRVGSRWRIVHIHWSSRPSSAAH